MQITDPTARDPKESAQGGSDGIHAETNTNRAPL